MGDQVPILLISAYDWSEIEERAKGAGVTGFISKPLFRSSLFDGLSAFAGTGVEEASSHERAVDLVLRGKRILLAEDNELNWEVAREMLSILEMELDCSAGTDASLAGPFMAPAFAVHGICDIDGIYHRDHCQ